MDVVKHSSAQSFLTASKNYRAADPVGTNLMGSIAEGVVAGRRYDGELWLTVHDRDAVVGAAVCTAPFALVAGPMATGAASALGDYLRSRGEQLPGLNGPLDVVVLVAERLGRPLSIRMRDVLRVLGTLLEPAPVDGKARRGAETDSAMVLQWESDFLAEAGLPPEHLPDDVTLAAMLQRLWLWEVDGVPVAMAAHAPIVQTPGGAVGRIGPVYTVPTARRRGIGAAVTSVVARHLLEQGCTAMLYADAANPTSNGVYERLGFQAVGEHIEADLLEPTGTSARWEKRIRS